MTAKTVDQLIREAEDVYRRGDAAASRALFERVVVVQESGRALEGIAKAHHLASDYQAAMAEYERACVLYRAEGDLPSAARCARTVGWFHGSLYGEWSVYNGWAARACTLLEQDVGKASQGWLLLVQAQRGDELNAQHRIYLEVLEIARQCGDHDLECDALASLGIMLTLSGVTAEGMNYLDEALAAVCSGEVTELSVVEGVMCGLFNICERTNDVVRAEQWIRAADTLVRSRGLVAVGGYCRAYYGGILTAAGRWDEAEDELSTALGIFANEHVGIRANVLCRLADLRSRQGRTEEAVELLVGLEHREDAARVVATVHLCRGEPVLARELIERTLSGGPFEDAVEGPLLALLVESHLACGALEQAAGAAARLDRMADKQTGRYLKALAAMTRGKVRCATGDGDEYVSFQEALKGFSEAHLPVDAARARLELAKSLASTQPEAAIVHAKAARVEFEHFGAQRDLDQAASVLRSLGVGGRTGAKGSVGLTARETEVLELVGRGLTNSEIGTRLFISPRTVEHHVGRIFTKLGLRSRAQAAAYTTRVRSSLEHGER